MAVQPIGTIGPTSAFAHDCSGGGRHDEEREEGSTVSAPTGHAAFHLFRDSPKHTGTKAGTKSQRRALLKESMRHLDPQDVARHAKKNASIVASDAHLNSAFVNDGSGGFRTTQSVTDVLAYGDAREARVRRKIAEGQTTVNLFVVHLPKTLCVEIEDFYPRVNPDGTQRLDPITGEPMSRSRWVARDHGEAMRYFADAVAFLGERVIPGGQEAIHGWATNFDETTPHIQLMADPFAPDSKALPSKPDALRTEQNQAYGSHREIRDDHGNQIGGKVKLRGYQAAMRTHMIARGWPVEAAPGPRRTGQPKSEYQATQDERADAVALLGAATHAEARAGAAQAEALRIQESAIDFVADAMADRYVSEYEHRLAIEEDHEELYGELGAEYALLQQRRQQVDEVLALERRMLNHDRTAERVEHVRALDTLRAQTDAAIQREREAEARARAAERREQAAADLEAAAHSTVLEAREVFNAAQELGREMDALAKEARVRLPASSIAKVREARAGHDDAVRRVLPRISTIQSRPDRYGVER